MNVSLSIDGIHDVEQWKLVDLITSKSDIKKVSRYSTNKVFSFNEKNLVSKLYNMYSCGPFRSFPKLFPYDLVITQQTRTVLEWDH